MSMDAVSLGSKPTVLMRHDESKKRLEKFCEIIEREVVPSRLSEPNLLVEFVENRVSKFKEVCVAIAETRVNLLRAERVGSASSKSASTLRITIERLMAARQAVIADAAISPLFIQFCTARLGEVNTAIAQATLRQEHASMARRLLVSPRLPAVEVRHDCSILELIEVLTAHQVASPLPGSLPLMGIEPYPVDDLFFKPASAVATGIPVPLFTKIVRLTTLPASPRGLKAEAAGASVARRDLVMPIGDDRKPVVLADWDAFDDILPFAARKRIEPVVPYCIPLSSPFSDLRELLSQDSWRRVRDEAVDRYNDICVMCGSSGSGAAKEDWAFLEPPKGAKTFGVQVLLDVRSYCKTCVDVVRPDPTKLTIVADAIPEIRAHAAEVVNPRLRRLALLNRWSNKDEGAALAKTVTIVRNAHVRRSNVLWTLDLSTLHRMNVSLHPDLVMHPDGWIMRQMDVSSYISGHAVARTRIFGCSFLNADSHRYFFPMPPIHETEWNTWENAIWVNRDLDEPSRAVADMMMANTISGAGPENPDQEDIMEVSGPPISAMS